MKSEKRNKTNVETKEINVEVSQASTSTSPIEIKFIHFASIFTELSQLGFEYKNRKNQLETIRFTTDRLIRNIIINEYDMKKFTDIKNLLSPIQINSKSIYSSQNPQDLIEFRSKFQIHESMNNQIKKSDYGNFLIEFVKSLSEISKEINEFLNGGEEIPCNEISNYEELELTFEEYSTNLEKWINTCNKQLSGVANFLSNFSSNISTLEFSEISNDTNDIGDSISKLFSLLKENPNLELYHLLKKKLKGYCYFIDDMKNNCLDFINNITTICNEFKNMQLTLTIISKFDISKYGINYKLMSENIEARKRSIEIEKKLWETNNSTSTAPCLKIMEQETELETLQINRNDIRNKSITLYRSGFYDLLSEIIGIQDVSTLELTTISETAFLNYMLIEAVDKNSNIFYRVKQYSLDKIEMVIEQVEILEKIKHSNIAELIGFYLCQDKLCIVMPYYSIGTLKDFSSIRSGWEDIWFQILSAIHHFHTYSFVHGNIRAANVYVKIIEDEQVKLILDGFDNVVKIEEKGNKLPFQKEMFCFVKMVIDIMSMERLDEYSSLLKTLMDSINIREEICTLSASELLRHEFFRGTRRKETKQKPSYWKSNQNNMSIIDVTAELKEDIQDLLDKTCVTITLGKKRNHEKDSFPYNKLQVLKVERIENLSLYEMYLSKKKHLISYKDKKKVMDIPIRNDFVDEMCELDSNVNEVYLWHGTTEVVKSIISEHGFDERLSALSGLFGAGIYFADCCSKSDQYCVSNKDGECFIFLSRVLLGQMVFKTREKMRNERRPPVIENSNGRVYDSVIGRSKSVSQHTYNEYIIYDRNQCYPEYLITYKRVLI
ncbi:predicted protein [Naegleria gruberi]|uniref:Poly [ADP-ribose] polymerase n=1 Tax=Naegleria gruberi TaxID=5762 RepID=D2V8J6_NAEGR|nr:uncharacterized protein NAEGRDRAFT_47537 [Naegleria gruberi]EFC46818.1 predicted protein [Naegleria gruberi]|eukprot:XP_002679562.1 predicted protein [Naegleria gruberi strain NEG-M]